VGDRVKVVFLSQLKFLRTLACKVTSGFLLVVLASCGGGSSNDSGGTTATQLQGYYQATALIGGLNKEFMALIVPSTGVNAKWYGWHFISEDVNGDGNEANLFTGTLSLGSNGAAQSTNSGVLSFSSAVPWKEGTGSIGITKGSLSSYVANMNYTPAGSTQVQVAMNATAAANNVYQFNQTSTHASLTGTWNGAWSSAGNVITANLVFQNNGTLLSATTFVNCNVNSAAPNGLSLTPVSGANYFNATVTLPVTLCSWSTTNPKILTGVGFIHASGLPLTPNRLELMLIDDQGRGIISFRGVK
jgi:hypothetical protein